VAWPKACCFSFLFSPCGSLLLDLWQQFLLYDLLLGILLVNDAKNRWQMALLCDLFSASILILTELECAPFVGQQIFLALLLLTAQ
jgi:hypothetical protein